MVRKLKLSDEIINRISNCADGESGAKMETAREMLIIWEETKHGFAAELAIQEGTEPDLGRTRTWFVESVCANVSTIAHTSGYNRMRVADNIISRGYDKKYDIISFSVWLFLLRNLKKVDGLVPRDSIQERIDWYYEEFDEWGKPPSTRDIEKHVKKNGDKQEWELLWINITRNAKKMAECDIENMPAKVFDIVQSINIYRGESVSAEEMEAEVSND